MTANQRRPGLILSVYPDYFRGTISFGPLTNCFTFLTGFDDQFMGSLGVVHAFRPEDLGWTNLATQAEWLRVVNAYFDPSLVPAQLGSVAEREGYGCTHDLYLSSQNLYLLIGLDWTPPTHAAVCFPMITGALDYHWAVHNGSYWVEQAGHGGPLQIWATIDDLVRDVYSRTNDKGQSLYVKDSAFLFNKRIA